MDWENKKRPETERFLNVSLFELVLAIYEQRNHGRDADGEGNQATVLIQFLGEGGGGNFLFHGTKLLIASSFLASSVVGCAVAGGRLNCSKGITRGYKAALKNLRKIHSDALKNTGGSRQIVLTF